MHYAGYYAFNSTKLFSFSSFIYPDEKFIIYLHTLLCQLVGEDNT